MSAVVNHYADDPAKVSELVNTIRELDDRLLAKAFDVGDRKMQRRFRGHAEARLVSREISPVAGSCANLVFPA
jgi:hypothetical protein